VTGDEQIFVLVLRLQNKEQTLSRTTN